MADPPDFDAARLKREERAGYNLIAARYAAGSSLRAGLNAALLDAARLAPGQQVLDVASGPGVLARAAARRLAGGLVVASDIAELALREGRSRAGGKDCRGLAFAAGDAERLCFPDRSFDRVLCGLGLMFFPQAAVALAEMARVLRPDGLLVLSVWGEEARTPLVACALRCIRRLLPPGSHMAGPAENGERSEPKSAPSPGSGMTGRPRPRPSPFRFGQPLLLRPALEAAGFVDVGIRSHALRCQFASPGDYWQAFRDLAGGAAMSLSRLPPQTLERLRSEVARELAPYRQDGGYALDSDVLIACARRA